MTIDRLVDAHVHLWDLQTLRYPWLTPPFRDVGIAGSVEPIARNYLLADYFADASHYNVQKIVHVDAGAQPADAVAETRWLQGFADGTGFPQAIVAFAALDASDAAAILEDHARSANLRGIRQILNWHPETGLSYTPRDLLDDPAFAAGYALLARHALSFDLQIYPNQMHGAYALVRQHPRTPVIINHAGMPVGAPETVMPVWREGMALFAALPNVFVKISGLGFVDRAWNAESSRALVLSIIDMFGPARCLFASDFPTDKLFNNFDHTIDAFDTIVADFSADERDALFAGNAERIYRI